MKGFLCHATTAIQRPQRVVGVATHYRASGLVMVTLRVKAADRTTSESALAKAEEEVWVTLELLQ